MMNKREAKIIALKDAATVLESVLGAGYPYNSIDDDGTPEHELEKIAVELRTISDVLAWRADDLVHNKRKRKSGRG